RGRGRLRQRWIPRPLRDRLQSQHSLPQQRRRDFHGRHGQGRSQWRRLVFERGLLRLRPRRRHRSVHGWGSSGPAAENKRCPAWRRIKHFCSMRSMRRNERLLSGFLSDLLAQRRLDRGFEFVRFYSMLQRASVFSFVKQRFRQMPVRRAELRGKLNRFGVVFDCLGGSALLLKSETALEKDLCLKLLIIRRAGELAAFRHRKAQLLERLRQQFLSAISLAELETTFRTVGSGSHCLLVKTDGSFQI